MNKSVSRIKVTLPRRRKDLLSRVRLNILVEELLDNQLILVSAPAGYGKTSLFIEAAHNEEIPFCWYNLDELDRDIYRFATHFIAAIDRRFEGFEAGCSEAVQVAFQNNNSPSQLARLIAEEIYQYVREHFVLVLDDYHMVDRSDAVNAFINRLIQDVDENVHVAVLSRSLFPFEDLPLMVARSQVGGLGFQELAFSPEEIQQLLLQNYNQIVPDNVAVDLAHRTEGWITGLLLSAQTMWQGMADRERVSRISGVKLYDYLIHQILNQQPNHLRNFLLRSSMFEEFDSDLCESVLGTPPAGTTWREMIDDIIQYNLFVLQIDDAGEWVRYHHLFRDFLQDRLEEENPHEKKNLLRSLAEIYTQRKDWERAYASLKPLEDHAAILQLLETAGEPMMRLHQLTRLAEWLDALPSGTLNKHPTLLARRGIVAATLGETHWGLQMLDLAIDSFMLNDDKVQLVNALVWRAHVYLIQANHTESLQDVEAVLKLSAENEIPPNYQAEALRIRGLNARILGELASATGHLTNSLDLYKECGDSASITRLLLDLGAVYIEIGALEAGLACYNAVLDYYRKEGNSYGLSAVLNDIGFVHYLKGEYLEAGTAFDEALNRSRTSGNRRVEALVLTGLGDLYIDLDVFQEAEEAYQQAEEIAHRIDDQFTLLYLSIAQAGQARIKGAFNQAQRHLLAAKQITKRSESIYIQALFLLETGRLALAENDPPKAISALEDAARLFKKTGQRVESCRANLCLAAALAQEGDHAEALVPLQRAFDLAQELNNLHTLVPTAWRVHSVIRAIKPTKALKPQFDSLITAIEQYDKSLQTYRLQLQLPQVLPSVETTKIEIQTFGIAQVILNGKTISRSDWQTHKARDLFFLILSSDTGWTKEAIGAQLWPESPPDKLRMRFKNTLYRLRRALGTNVILFKDDRYYFNRNLDYTYDVQTFAHYLETAESADTPQNKALIYRKALDLYKGDYLPETDGAWTVVEREYLRQANVDISLKLARIQLDTEEFNSALTICLNLLGNDPALEEAHRIAMRAHAALGNRAAVIEQYLSLKQVLSSEMGVPPSSQTESLYSRLIQ